MVVGLEPLESVRPDVGLESTGQRVHHGDPDAVQTTGDLVGPLFELPAGVQNGHHDVDRRNAGGVHRHWDAATVVGDLDTAVFEDPHVDLGGESRHRLVDRVVDHLPDKVV
jgi:hypothetical protein